jgi:hypothetical protein
MWTDTEDLLTQLREAAGPAAEDEAETRTAPRRRRTGA